MERTPIPPEISSSRVLAIGRSIPPDRIALVADALANGGVRAFEVTLDSAGALEAITRLQAGAEGRSILIGAGTVIDRRSAQAAVSAGATFLVAPHTDAQTIRWARDHGVPIFPGATTPTEILRAWQLGASAVKLFPAGALGVEYLSQLRGPLADIPFIPTGGITVTSAPAYIKAGAVAVGVGSWLTSPAPELVASRAQTLTDAVRLAA